MNQPLFKNILYKNEQATKEPLKYISFDSPSSMGGYIFFACVSILFMCTAAITVSITSFISGLIFIGFFIAATIISYHSNIKRTLARDKELAMGREMIITNVVYDDRIELICYETRNSINLNDIKSAVILENYIILNTKAKQFLTLQNNSFVLGTYEDFINFLTYKGIKVK